MRVFAVLSSLLSASALAGVTASLNAENKHLTELANDNRPLLSIETCILELKQ